MRRFYKVFLTSAALAVFSCPAIAQDDSLPASAAAQAPAGISEAPDAPETATETAVAVAPAVESARECADQGSLLQEPSEFLSVFYKPQSFPITRSAEVITLENAQGAMVVSGVTYQLQKIEFPRFPAVPLNSVDYKRTVQFVHKAEDGSIAILSVPVMEGTANPALESFINGQSSASLDPNDFLPATRQYAPAGMTQGPDCTVQQSTQYLLMLQPVEMSASQLAKLAQQFEGEM